LIGYRNIARSVGARFGLVPAQRALAELQRRGINLESLRALEVFGADGERVTRFYGHRVASLEIWEINSRYERTLRHNYPNATIRIVDAFVQMRQAEGPYDLVVIDNPGWIQEHFELFPEVFAVLSDDATLLFNVIPCPTRGTRRRYPRLFGEEHLELRRRFYGTDDPERIGIEELARHYGELALSHGFQPQWHFHVRRREIWHGVPVKQELYFLCLKLARGNRPNAY
jgi:hypothetical protein